MQGGIDRLAALSTGGQDTSTLSHIRKLWGKGCLLTANDFLVTYQ